MIGRFHFPLLLLALAIALVIKVAVHETVQLSEATFTAPVQYSPPKDVVILERVDEVRVRLRGKRAEIAELNPLSVGVEVALREGELGIVEVTRDRMQVHMPGDFEVISIEPDRFTLQVEVEEEVTLPVRVQLVGEPAAGASYEAPLVLPPKAEVRGPRSRIERIGELVVRVSLDGHAITFDETIPLVSPDPMVKIISPSEVTVRVSMQEPGLRTPIDDLLEEP